MIEDLIDFERVNTGEWSHGLASVDLATFLRVFSKRIEADAPLFDRKVFCTIALPQPSYIYMDERLVTRALENLVNNALRYTSSGGRIDIAAKAKGGNYIVSIIDDGPGIAPQDLPHIFELFYRGSSSRNEPGMGLGLSIVKTVVESHGWAIEVLPGRDRGAAFVLTIPVSAT
jgi:signal transduction histidine kinase